MTVLVPFIWLFPWLSRVVLVAVLSGVVVQARRRNALKLVEQQNARLKVHSDRLKELQAAREAREMQKRLAAEAETEATKETLQDEVVSRSGT